MCLATAATAQTEEAELDSISRFTMGFDGATNGFAGNGRATAITRDGSGMNGAMQIAYTHESHWTLGVQFKVGTWADLLHDRQDLNPYLSAASAMGLVGYGSERWLLWASAGQTTVSATRDLDPYRATAEQELRGYEEYYHASKAHIYEAGVSLTLLRGDHWGLDVTGRYEMLHLPGFPAGGGRETAVMGRLTAGLQVSKTIVRGKNGDRLLDYYMLPPDAYVADPVGAIALTAVGNGFVFCTNVIDGALGSVAELVL